MQLMRVVARPQVNIDGGPENWNHTVLAFLCHLVSIDVFDAVQLFRFLVGHTHNDQDQKFSRLAIALHGYGMHYDGKQCLTPSAFAEALRNAYLDDSQKPDVVSISSVFDFVSYYEDHLAPLSNFASAAEVTSTDGEAARLEGKKSTHLRVAYITKDPPTAGSTGPRMASIRFAESPDSAARGEWFPAPRAPGSDPAAPPPWCTLGKQGAPVLLSEPEDVPTRVRFKPANWVKCNDFLDTLRAAEMSAAWPPAAAAVWKAFLHSPPDALDGVTVDLLSLVPGPAAAAAPPIVCGTDRRLVVCPLITATRTRKDKEQEVQAVLGRQSGRFDVPYDDLRVGDFAFAVAPAAAENGFTLSVQGRQSALVELLELVQLVKEQGKPRSCLWRYWRLKGRRNGTLNFEPYTNDGKVVEIVQPYIDPTKKTNVGAKASEMLMVWPMTDAARATCIADGVYTLAVEQLHDLQDWCVLRSCLSPHLALTRRSLSTETIDVVDNKDDATSNSDDDEPVACKRSRKGGAAAGGSRRKGAPRAQARAAGAAAAPSGLRGASARAPAPASGMHTRARAQS